MLHSRTSRLGLIAALVILGAACTSNADPTTTTIGEPTTTTTTTGGDTTSSSAVAITTTTTSSTTTTEPSTTTTTRPRVTTTTQPPVTTTIPAGNRAPTVEILSPAALSAHVAAYDVVQKDFGAYIEFSANASDPDGDPVEVRWSASTQGALGTGDTITVWISTKGSDATQPVITATAVDQWGVEGAASIQIIVWIPSDA